MRKITTATVLLVVWLMGCSSGLSQEDAVDIEATVEARVATAIASQPIPTAKVIVEEIEKIVEVKVIEKEIEVVEKIVEVPVIKEVIKEVEKIVEVEVVKEVIKEV